MRKRWSKDEARTTHSKSVADTDKQSFTKVEHSQRDDERLIRKLFSFSSEREKDVHSVFHKS